MLEATHITKSFGRLRALDDFSVAMPAGRSFSLIGPNGSGKTTFLKCLLGLVTPDSGDIRWGGQTLLGDSSMRACLGYMPQMGRFPDNMRIGQIFEMMQEIRRGAARLDEDLKVAFGMESIAHKPMRTLSGGTRQKVSACLAFLFDPSVLVLDEPTAGLDPVAAEVLKEKILAEKRKGKLILITSHILSDLDEITTDVLFLHEGRLRFNRPIEQLKADSGESMLAKAIARIMRDPENLGS